MFIAQNSATRFEKKNALLKCPNFDGKRQTRNCSLTFAVPRKNAMLKVSNNIINTQGCIFLANKCSEVGNFSLAACARDPRVRRSVTGVWYKGDGNHPAICIFPLT